MIRHIEFARLYNFRDVGGYRTDGGLEVRWRRLYRSASLHMLADDDLDRFHALGVRTVIDLRHPDEVARRGRAPEGPGYHNLPVERRRWDTARDYHPDAGVARFFADRYLEVAHDGHAELRSALEVIAEAGNAPVVVHCAAGKDRTGLLVALVLRLLGVSEEDVVADYALTELARPQMVAYWEKERPAEVRWAGFGRAPAEAMRLFLEELGPVRDHCLQTLGVDKTVISALRNHLLKNPDNGAISG
ncbi:tyrosine-protein phosphatase [Streptosporangium sp. NPDC002721]|uniref:tyrosine-protein phosphatase n=1 Tax=Streptosporangium sp. NPDC002721 TaxID=3366188 RepID=UPI0036770CB5